MKKNNQQLLLEKLQQMDGKNGFAKFPILAVNQRLLELIWGNNYPANFCGKQVRAIQADGIWLMERWPSAPNALKPNQFQGVWYFSESVKVLKVDVHLYAHNHGDSGGAGLCARLRKELKKLWGRYVRRQPTN